MTTSCAGSPRPACWATPPRRAGQAVAVIGVTVAGAKAAAVWIVLSPAKLGGWHRR
jgi:hypothetical protein